MAKGSLEALRKAGVYLPEGEAVENITPFLDKCRRRNVTEGGGISQEVRDEADAQVQMAVKRNGGRIGVGEGHLGRGCKDDG